MTFTGLRAEAGQYRRAFSAAWGKRPLIVAGTGLVTDADGLFKWGPYGVFKWALMARLRGSKSSSSASERARSIMLGRVLIRAALSLADYRSYRDHASKEYLKGIGF